MTTIGLQVTPQGSTSTVRGLVTKAGSTAPLPGAEITLTSATVVASGPAPEVINNLIGNLSIRLVTQPVNATGPGNPVITLNNAPVTGGTIVPVVSPPGLSLNAVADAEGCFEIPNVPAGTYTVTARLDGFVGSAAEDGVSPIGSSKRVNVVAGEDPPGIVLPLAPGGTIEGRITRSDGKPASGVSVVPYLLTYREGRASIVAGGVTRTTDDRGQYRIFWLGPGEYIVSATRPPGSQGDAPTRAFFPGTLDASEAVRLVVRENAGLTGIDFSIPQGGTFSIRGRAVNPLQLPVPRRLPNGDADPSVPIFSLVSRDGALGDAVPRQIQNVIVTEAGRRNGEFEIRGVRPGLYDLFPIVAVLLDGQQRFASGRIPVEVRDRDVEGLVMALTPGVELRGQLRLKGSDVAVKFEALSVGLRPLDSLPAMVPARIGTSAASPAGVFVLRSVPEALYTLAVTPLPATIYIADIRQNNESVFDSGIAVGKENPASVEVVLDTNGQTLEGIVIDEKQSPVANAAVVLVPPQARRQNPILYRAVKSREDGRFTISNVAPGDYKIFAWRQVQVTAWMNAAFISRYEAQGRNVTVKTDNNASLRLQVISPAK
jgi:hypothetical protein